MHAYGDCQLELIKLNQDSKQEEKKTEELNPAVKKELIDKAQKSQEQLESILYQVFIDMADHLKFRINVLFQYFGSAKIIDWKDEEILSLFNYFGKIFTSEYSVTRCVKTFSLMLCTYKPDITWLDEIAETLKGTAIAYSNYITFALNLPLRVRQVLEGKHELLTFF